MGSAKKKVLVSIGTRPECIKMAPLIQRMKLDPAFEVSVCVTAQHREMLDQVLALFKIRPDFDLNLMRERQTLASLSSAALTGLTEVLERVRPSRVLVHGDTTTAAASAIAAFYQKIPVGHVEAGLRSGDLYAPWPEEANRKFVGVVADVHFSPTEGSKLNLMKEGVPGNRVWVTGNTVIDALLETVRGIEAEAGLREQLESNLPFLNTDKKIIMVTGHRRENFGSPFESICRALISLADRGDTKIIYPVHKNPNIREPAHRLLGAHPNIDLIEPLEYLSFVYLMSRAHFIITDSGGIQEEAPSLRKPVLVLREVTERPEAILAGAVKLVGTDQGQIVAEASRLLDSESAYLKMTGVVNPYGDGQASQRIMEVLKSC
jgi:UDP-N-acetylglucosamine 2-epimerase (non-hydrolysing)